MTERNPEQGDTAKTVRPESGSSEEPQAIGTILPGIEHIVVLMFENRSFDNMLGGLYPQKSTEDYDGLQKKKCIPSCSETDPSPVCTWSAPYGLDAMIMPYPDPGELFEDMNEQIFGPGCAWEAETMKGFACNYIKQEASPDGVKPVAENIMQFYQPGDQGNIPITTALAQAYGVSDQWFASGPVQTLANRIFAHCATPGKYQDSNNVWHANIDNTDITNVYIDPDGSIMETPVFQLLDQAASQSGWPWQNRVPWKVYYHDWPLSAFIKYVDDNWSTVYGGNVYPFKEPWYEDTADFFYDVRNDLPTYCFIEPRYTDYFGGAVNSNHPGGSTIDENPPAISVCDGELLLQTVYTTLYNAPNNLFEKTLLIVLYDEHGGLYDHVAPLPATPPFSEGEVEGFNYNRYGVRVPAIFINPRIRPQTIVRSALEQQGFDHTTIISTLRKQFCLGGPLTPRDANATTLEGLIDPNAPLNPFTPDDLPTLNCPPPASLQVEPGALRAAPRPHSVAAAIKKAIRSPKNQARVQRLKGPKP
jgi:phospholipase C